MRILYICNEYPPAVHGGIGIFTRTLAERLVTAGHAAAVVGFASHAGHKTEEMENGVHVVRLPWPRSRAQLRWGPLWLNAATVATRKMLSFEASRQAAEFGPDLVESHDWSGPLWTAPCRPWVVRVHGAASVQAHAQGKRSAALMRHFERRNLRMADAVVSASEFIGHHTHAALRLRRAPFSTIYHGIDIDQFRPQTAPRDSHEVLFASTVKKSKGIQEFFRILPLVVAACPQAHFTIAGRCSEDPSNPCAPPRLLETLPGGLRGLVRFLGHVPQTDLARLYARSAVVVFPSHGEAFGLACVEAMSCGAAVVMTVCGSGPELIEPGRSGLLVEPSDTASLAFAVTRLLHDAELRRNLGANARVRVAEKFNLSAAAERNIEFYERVVRCFAKRESVHV